MDGTAPNPLALTSTPPRGRGFVRRHWMLCSLTVVAALAVASGLAAWRVLHPSVAAKYATQNVVFSQPNAPHLTAAPGERVYRIDPMQSSVQYTVKEELFGVGVHRAHGITNGVAGDIALNSEAPARSRVGEIVVNVEQLHSDNSLRDAQIRKGYLSSHTFRFAYFNATTLTGLPAKLTQGRTYRFNLLGVLKVKNTQRPITWTVAGSLANGKLDATAVTHVKMSQFGIGPIELAGLVSTSDDVTLTMHLVAEDPSRYDVPTTVPVPNAAHRGAATSPSFKAAVMPILEADCASCHNSGGVGAAHWKLDTAGDAAQYADGVSAVVRAKYMPPWPASDKGIALANSKALDQKSIAVLEKWSDAGGPIDVPAATKIAPSKTRSVPHPRPDKTLTMRRAYAGSLSTPNDYRCFVLDPQLTTPTWLTGYEVVPGDREEIHHVQIFHISAAQAHAGQVASGQDGKPGWSCGKNLQLAISMQSGLIAAWAPGQDPTIYPEHAGILLQPGDALMLQIHYHYDLPPSPDRSTVILQTAPGTDHLRALDIVNPVAPVEIPCLPSQRTAPLCNRDNAVKEDVRLYGPADLLTEPGLLLQCGQTFDEMAARFHDGIASSVCDYHVPESGTLVSVFGHMHTLGKSFRFTLDPDTPHSKILLDIPAWNFGWQMNYALAQPFHVDAGATIRMSCSWDRSLDPNRPAKYIVFAEGTEDEMCFGTYAIIPDNQRR